MAARWAARRVALALPAGIVSHVTLLRHDGKERGRKRRAARKSLKIGGARVEYGWR
jgi:hypothetical protein